MKIVNEEKIQTRFITNGHLAHRLLRKICAFRIHSESSSSATNKYVI